MYLRTCGSFKPANIIKELVRKSKSVKGSHLSKSNKFLSLQINGIAICGSPSFGYYWTSFSLEQWKATF
jgi:hypothetical protein